jgi:hypothetical protein
MKLNNMPYSLLLKYCLQISFLLFLLNGCSKSTIMRIDPLENEISALNTIALKIAYLEKILDDDQKVRDGEKSFDLMTKYGSHSKESMEYSRTQNLQDSINCIKIEKYLQTHGYPTKEMGNKATTAPWMVIHHAPDIGIRERNFKYVYKAYLENNIDHGALAFYLGRMYEIKHNQRFRMKSPYTVDQELDALISTLGLNTIKNEVQVNLKTKAKR